MKFLKIFLIVIIFVNSALSLAFANDETENVSPSKPTLKMGGNNTYSIEAGKSTEVTIPIVNTSADTAFDVLIQAKPGDNSPITVNFKNNSNRVSTILRGGSHNVTMSIDIDKNATTGKYPITLEYSFTGTDKQSFTSSDTFYVKIDNGSVVPTVALNNLKVSKDSVILGDSFDISGSLESNTYSVNLYMPDGNGNYTLSNTYDIDTNSKTTINNIIENNSFICPNLFIFIRHIII